MRGPLRKLLQVTRLSLIRREMRMRNNWNPSKIKAFQDVEIAKIRSFAAQNSPFYKKLHSGFLDKPLSDLPVITKSDLMQNWDEIVTDQSLKLTDTELYILNMAHRGLFKGRYHVTKTSGSTPQQAVLAFNEKEWRQVLTSYTRALDLAGITKNYRALKLAVVASRTPWHQSGQIARSFSRFISGKFIDATVPIDQIVAELNKYAPKSLSAYPSTLVILAGEQLANRLKISPKIIFSSAEPLTESTRELITSAWGVRPKNLYVASEASVIGAECSEGNTHLFDDLMKIEVVDKMNRPVRAGEVGAKILLTSFFGTTLPLIRYEIEDSIQLMNEPCACGSPLTGVTKVDGKQEDTLMMKDDQDRSLAIHPNVFLNAIQTHPVGVWQVFQKAENVIEICITAPGEGFDGERLKEDVLASLLERGVHEPLIDLKVLASPYRNSAGKMPSIQAMKSTSQTP